jgi:hypothetical protein
LTTAPRERLVNRRWPARSPIGRGRRCWRAGC